MNWQLVGWHVMRNTFPRHYRKLLLNRYRFLLTRFVFIFRAFVNRNRNEHHERAKVHFENQERKKKQ